MSEDTYDAKSALKYLVTPWLIFLGLLHSLSVYCLPLFWLFIWWSCEKKKVLFLWSGADCPGAPFPICSQLRLPSAVGMIQSPGCVKKSFYSCGECGIPGVLSPKVSAPWLEWPGSFCNIKSKQKLWDTSGVKPLVNLVVKMWKVIRCKPALLLWQAIWWVVVFRWIRTSQVVTAFYFFFLWHSGYTM